MHTYIRVHMRRCDVTVKYFGFRYHTGSLAFGALILAIVQLIRVILEYLDHKLKGEIYESALSC